MRQMSRLALLTPATILTIVPCSSPYDDTGSNPSIQRGTSREVGRPHSVAALSRSKRQPPRRSFDPRSPVRVRSGERNLSATIALPQIHIFPPPTAVDDFIIKGTKPSHIRSYPKLCFRTPESSTTPGRAFLWDTLGRVPSSRILNSRVGIHVLNPAHVIPRVFAEIDLLDRNLAQFQLRNVSHGNSREVFRKSGGFPV